MKKSPDTTTKVKSLKTPIGKRYRAHRLHGFWIVMDHQYSPKTILCICGDGLGNSYSAALIAQAMNCFEIEAIREMKRIKPRPLKPDLT